MKTNKTKSEKGIGKKFVAKDGKEFFDEHPYWHDLKKNPDDLPKDGVRVLLYYNGIYDGIIDFKGVIDVSLFTVAYGWKVDYPSHVDEPIAWYEHSGKKKRTKPLKKN